MKKFLFAAALACLFASVGTAEEKAVVASAPVTVAAPVMVSSVPAMEATSAQTQRRGLFGRLRNRNSTPTMTTTAPTTIAAPVMTAPTAMAMPMPAATVATPMPKPTAPSDVVAASGTVMAEPVVTTAAYTEPAQTQRRGLFGRLRNR